VGKPSFEVQSSHRLHANYNNYLILDPYAFLIFLNLAEIQRIGALPIALPIPEAPKARNRSVPVP